MEIKDFHLSYCSNIHPGESWEATFENLKRYIPEIKNNLQHAAPFGIGLRLSDEASRTLEKPSELQAFHEWLDSENAYVFTLNGFPYGGFHRQVVKEKVHVPDWTTHQRKEYTIRSFRILSKLLPSGMDGGISTSPISYRHWFNSSQELEVAMEVATLNLLEVVEELIKLYRETGKVLHVDIEPEPDGILENSDEMIWFFNEWLLKMGREWVSDRFDITLAEAEQALKTHVRVCYDVCHFAIMYEDPTQVFEKFRENGIQVGKIQLSAALKLDLRNHDDRDGLLNKLLPFAESTYLHQVVGKKANGQLKSYPDLPEALEVLKTTNDQEWRIHFHVPVFLDNYGNLLSTQSSISLVLNEIKHNPSLTKHLEVETYTWEVLPESTKLSLGESISRELNWVIRNLI